MTPLNNAELLFDSLALQVAVVRDDFLGTDARPMR
jgi:hypothetical protein